MNNETRISIKSIDSLDFHKKSVYKSNCNTIMNSRNSITSVNLIVNDSYSSRIKKYENNEPYLKRRGNNNNRILEEG